MTSEEVHEEPGLELVAQPTGFMLPANVNGADWFYIERSKELGIPDKWYRIIAWAMVSVPDMWGRPMLHAVYADIHGRLRYSGEVEGEVRFGNQI